MLHSWTDQYFFLLLALFIIMIAFHLEAYFAVCTSVWEPCSLSPSQGISNVIRNPLGMFQFVFCVPTYRVFLILTALSFKLGLNISYKHSCTLTLVAPSVSVKYLPCSMNTCAGLPVRDLFWWPGVSYYFFVRVSILYWLFEVTGNLILKICLEDPITVCYLTYQVGWK